MRTFLIQLIYIYTYQIIGKNVCVHMYTPYNMILFISYLLLLEYKVYKVLPLIFQLLNNRKYVHIFYLFLLWQTVIWFLANICLFVDQYKLLLFRDGKLGHIFPCCVYFMFIFKVLTKRSREKELCLYSIIRYLFN